MEYIPALSILAAFLLITLTLIYKFKTEQILKIIESKNFFLVGILIIIFLLLTFYLFRVNEVWVTDLLKIAIGVFAGAGATAVKKKDFNESSLSFGNDTTISGQGNKLAGRDINETIHNIEKAFSEIKDSVINQDYKIEKISESSTQLDHSIHMIYTRDNIFRDIQTITTKRINEGWTLQNIEFAFEKIDGVILLFTRGKLHDKPELTVFRDITFEQLS